jgi:hypothetical protein
MNKPESKHKAKIGFSLFSQFPLLPLIGSRSGAFSSATRRYPESLSAAFLTDPCFLSHSPFSGSSRNFSRPAALEIIPRILPTGTVPVPGSGRLEEDQLGSPVDVPQQGGRVAERVGAEVDRGPHPGQAPGRLLRDGPGRRPRGRADGGETRTLLRRVDLGILRGAGGGLGRERIAGMRLRPAAPATPAGQAWLGPRRRNPLLLTVRCQGGKGRRGRGYYRLPAMGICPLMVPPSLERKV